MKKLLKILLLPIIILVFIAIALPYYTGYKVRQNLDDQYHLLGELSFLDIRDRDYQQGWLTSTESMTIQFKPSFLSGIIHKLPENLQPIFQEPITLTNNIHHGWLQRAEVDTEFQFQPKTQVILARFFGQQKPITLHNYIDFHGNGKMTIAIPAFEYEELSGIRLKWQGLNGQVNYASDYQSYESTIHNPGLTIHLADKGEMAYRDLTLYTNTFLGKNQIALGDSQLSVHNFSFTWQDKLDYDIRINDLINLLTDLQIGTFINPHSQLASTTVQLDQLQLATHMTEDQKGINSIGKFTFNKLNYGGTDYGPLHIEVQAQHLEPQSLLALKTKLNQLSMQNLPSDAMQAAVLQVAKNEGLKLFTHNPDIELKAFRFQTPDGLVDVTGKLNFPGITVSDQNNVEQVINKMQTEIHLSLPQRLLENIAIDQAQKLFSISSQESDNINIMQDIQDTIRIMVISTLKSMQQDGYLDMTNGQISTLLTFKNNKLSLNGKTFQSDPEFDPEEEKAYDDAPEHEDNH